MMRPSMRSLLLFCLFVHIGCFSISPTHEKLRSSQTCLFQRKASAASSEELRPRLIVLDLDGNLWRPEMYELAWDGYRHAPFEPWGQDGTRLKSSLGTVVSLIGDVPELLDEHFGLQDPLDTKLAISSRTDVPEWAKELLEKFRLPKSQKTLAEVITGPWEIRSDSKVHHFERLAKSTGVRYDEMVFFDNEQWNCQSIAKLGVTVGYCPNGVKRHIWEKVMQAFPNSNGGVIGL